MIRLSKSVIGKEEVSAVTNVLKKGFLGMGEEVQQFEQLLSDRFCRPVICVNTGTAALQLALQGCGIGVGDEVLVQSLTYLASFQAISASGASPIACEVNTENLTIDLGDAQKRLTKQTKAIMPVHYSGNPGDLDAIYSFAKKNNLRVIEDAAHAFGSLYKNKQIGSFGDICCFSFDGIKNITSGEGGAIITNDQSVIDRVKDLRLLSVSKDSDNRYKNQRSWDFDVVEQGWRYHMSNIMAAIGIEQLKKFNSFQEKRKVLSSLYKQFLSGVSGIELLHIDYTEITPHIFVIKVKSGRRDLLKIGLENCGIQTGMHYKPNHLLKYYSSNSLPLTEKLYNEILTLPLHPDLMESDIAFICEKIKNIL
ncbi:MAG: aminotransferase [Bacteroidetes bacterium GWF2_42_66]|nr:MAG: aminotransferase [Bacteroidetes bacterium GWA2_42_15]OFX96314.1 MAG: aminotransferase [Bacteroidetes bacterium GWE2_42_39]OFY46353.1 MAG: aminotransferase [Bacteroidetes bacterium GWF2_42_66]HAZ03475.1 aminotransferase [Marinilabiliales bacterium]HBL78261.1 aminotransferase [Prolixibacteraceae bacterium]